MGRWSTATGWRIISSTPQVRVLDVRGRHPSSSLPHAKRLEYEAGHIPGAVFVDWEHDFIDADDPVPVQVAGAEAFAARAGTLGIGDGDLVVTYDDYYGIFAGRVAWAFRYYGADARVLDGGWSTWHDEGRPDQRGVNAAEPEAVHRLTRGRGCAARSPRLRTLGPAVRRWSTRAPATCSSASRASRTLAISPARAACPTRSWSMARPGCGQLPRPSHDLPATPVSIPVVRRDELIATCGSGVSATVALLALERIGVHCDGVYDGSFNEWSSDPARPVAYGRAA